MKNTFKFIMAVVFASSSLFYSCETIELELVDDPNNLTPEQADPNLLLNNIQLAYAGNAQSFNGNGETLTRIKNFGSRNYFAGLTGGTLDFAWSNTYAGIYPDVANLELLASTSDQDLRFHVGIGKIMQAHSTLLLVDYIGDVPFDQTGNPQEFPAPMAQDGAEVYAGAIVLLDEAIALLNTIDTDVSGSVEDFFYDEDPEAWVKAANTIKMKAYITTGNLTAFNSIVTSGNYITEASEDLQFQFGTNLLNPNVRHPDYNADYTPSGANIYQSNWLMNTMQESNDPRITYYYYRQTDCTPGASCNADGNGETLSCSLQTPPVHYVLNDFTFCNLENGYWGRDHGNNEGAPPDNFLRTASGVYPSAGLYDQGSFGQVGLSVGGQGAGIEPIILSSYVDFWRAEAAMEAGNVDEARDLMISATEKSIDKVQSFGSLDPNNDGSTEPGSAEVTTFLSDIETAFDDASSMDDKYNILAEQYWVAMFGGGAEAYNFYRRQGFPTSLQGNLEEDPGPFPRSFPYAQSEVGTNPNINQKPDLNGQVFWDTNPPSSANGGFPAAN